MLNMFVENGRYTDEMIVFILHWLNSAHHHVRKCTDLNVKFRNFLEPILLATDTGKGLCCVPQISAHPSTLKPKQRTRHGCVLSPSCFFWLLTASQAKMDCKETDIQWKDVRKELEGLRNADVPALPSRSFDHIQEKTRCSKEAAASVKIRINKHKTKTRKGSTLHYHLRPPFSCLVLRFVRIELQ